MFYGCFAANPICFFLLKILHPIPIRNKWVPLMVLNCFLIVCFRLFFFYFFIAQHAGIRQSDKQRRWEHSGSAFITGSTETTGFVWAATGVAHDQSAKDHRHRRHGLEMLGWGGRYIGDGEKTNNRTRRTGWRSITWRGRPFNGKPRTHQSHGMWWLDQLLHC